MKQIDWIEASLSKEERLEVEIKKLSEQCEKNRKSFYARDTAQDKVIRELKEQIDFLYSHVCKNNIR